MCGEKHCASFTDRRIVGITPACAGKRRKEPMVAVSQLNHPRVCGEKFTRFVLQKTPYGSPPRMRGKVRG